MDAGHLERNAAPVSVLQPYARKTYFGPKINRKSSAELFLLIFGIFFVIFLSEKMKQKNKKYYCFAIEARR